MANLTIKDAFKSLEDINDDIVVKTVAKRFKGTIIKEGLNLEEAYIYLFPDEDAMGDYKSECKKFNLKYLGKNHFEDENNLVIKGSKKNIEDYANSLGYDLHPDYLYKEDEFGGEIIQESCEVNEAPVSDLEPRYDSRNSFYKKAKVDDRDNGVKVCKSYGTPVALIKDGKAYLLQGVVNYYGYRTSATTLRHVKEFLKQNGFNAESLKQIENDYEVITDYKQYQSMINESVETENKMPLKESEFVNLGDKEDIEKGKDIIAKGKENDENIEQIVDVDAETIDELKDSYIGNVILQCPVCRTLIYKKPDALEKSEEDEKTYNVEDECPHCGAKEGYALVGQVASLDVEGEEKEETTGTDISKLTDNEEDNNAPEIDGGEEDDSKRVEDEKGEDEEFTFESLDELKFNKLVSKYMKNIYENVEGFKTTDGYVDDEHNKLVVEGIITYKDGKTKSSKFIFDCLSKTKDNTVKFKGLNETFTKAKKPFTLIASVKNNTLKCESLNYNYNVKVNNEVKKVKGKVNLLNK